MLFCRNLQCSLVECFYGLLNTKSISILVMRCFWLSDRFTGHLLYYCNYNMWLWNSSVFGVFFQLLKGHGHNLSWKFFNFIFQFKCWQSFTIKEFVMVNQNWMSGEQLQMRYRANNSLLYMNKSKLLTCFCIQMLYNHVYVYW